MAALEQVSTLEDRATEAHLPQPPAAESRPLDALLARVYMVNWEFVGYLVIFVLAVLTRFVDLGGRAMSHDESLHTKFSWDLYENGVFQHSPLMHGPLLFHMTALAYTLFGDDDFTSRIYVAAIGVLVVLMPILFRRWLGKVGAMLASIVLLVSPMVMYYSRYIRHDMPAIFFALVMVWAIFQYIDGSENVRRKPYWLYLLSAAMVLLLASKEVAFIYIAIFGSFLTLFWLVQMAQRYLKLRGGRSLFYLINAGIILGVFLGMGLIAVLSIIPPDDYDQDGITNAVDNCVDVSNTNQLDVDENGFGDACQTTPGPSLAGRMVVWTLGIVAVLGVALVGSALWAARGNGRTFPWAEILLVVGIAVVACSFFIVFEEASRTEIVQSEPVDPNAADTTTTGLVTSTPIILAWVIGAIITAIAILARPLGFWDELRQLPVFDVLIVMGTLILPWLTAFVIYATGALPTDYSVTGIARAAVSLVPFAVVAIVVGLAWNWRVWLPVAGIFMALYAFFFTTMFTNGQGLASGMIGSLGYWLEQQSVRRGNQPQYYYVLLLVPFYEFLPALGSIGAGILGLVTLWRHRLSRLAPRAGVPEPVAAGDDPAAALPDVAPTAVPEKPKRRPDRLNSLPLLLFVGYWAAVNLIAYTLAGEKMPWLTTHLTVPMALLAGWFGGRVVAGISLESFRRRGWRLLFLVPLLLVALLMVLRPWSIGQYPFQGLSQLELEHTYAWLAALAVAAGVMYLIARITAQIGLRQLVRLSAASVGILLTLVTARSALMASFPNADYPNEYLVYAHAAPANKWMVEWLEDISLRMYGDLSIRVAYDNKMSWPGSWYLRDFPNAVYFGTSPSVQVLDDAVAIAVGEENRARVEPLLGDRYYAYEMMRLWWPNQDYFSLTAARIDEFFDFSPGNVTSANLRLGTWEIWWYRDYSTYGQAVGRPQDFDLSTWSVRDRMILYIRKDVAAQIWDLGVGAEVIAEFDTPLA
ncbi:MAG: TIGR03663 family protein, partial [Anaerolineae bacterium]|nr:TIGR03663 family protein [Anaerolineae bacterium]